MISELAALLALRYTSWCEWKLSDKGSALLLGDVGPMLKTMFNQVWEGGN